MNTLFTSRLNGIFILNTLLELHKPVTVSELAGIINHRYDHVTAPRKMVSADTVKRFLNDFYQTTSGTDYCSIRLFCFKKNRYGSLVPDHDLENVYGAAPSRRDYAPADSQPLRCCPAPPRCSRGAG